MSDDQYAGEATPGAGWVLLGAVMLGMLGAVHVGTGLVALFRPEALAGGRSDLVLAVGLTGLAWLHVVLGALAVAAGVGLVRGRSWARVTAVLLAGLAALVNFAFIQVHPVWSITAITMTVVVIHAVAVHGGELADAYGRS